MILLGKGWANVRARSSSRSKVKNPVAQKPSPSEEKDQNTVAQAPSISKKVKNPVPLPVQKPSPSKSLVQKPSPCRKYDQKPSRSKTQSLKNPVAQEPEIPPCKKSKTQSLDWHGTKTQSLAFVASPKTQSLKNPVPEGLGFWTVPIEGLGFWTSQLTLRLVLNDFFCSSRVSAPRTPLGLCPRPRLHNGWPGA